MTFLASKKSTHTKDIKFSPIIKHSKNLSSFELFILKMYKLTKNERKINIKRLQRCSPKNVINNLLFSLKYCLYFSILNIKFCISDDICSELI